MLAEGRRGARLPEARASLEQERASVGCPEPGAPPGGPLPRLAEFLVGVGARTSFLLQDPHGGPAMERNARTLLALVTLAAPVCIGAPAGAAQETDQTQTPNAAGAGILLSLEEQVGAGRGDLVTPGSSRYLIARDPFRSIVRGRQLFQRKFTQAQGLGPRFQDGVGTIEQHAALGAGLADSCASCHGRPQGSAGTGGNVFTRPTSRDAPHLFGIGLVEMLADEMTADLRRTRERARRAALGSGSPVLAPLRAKGVSFGSLTALPNGTFDTSQVEGVDADLRVRPFFAEGSLFSLREFAVGAFAAEMGLQAFDPDLAAASAGGRLVTPAGLVLDGAQDAIGAPPAASALEDPDGDGRTNEVDVALLDHTEFYLLNYFRPATGRPSAAAARGEQVFAAVGCASCHVPDLTLERDRRVADVDTRWDEQAGNPFNRLYASAVPLFDELQDDSGHPALRRPRRASFLVRGIFSDLKRHDLGPAFWERGFDGSVQELFVTEPLWGVASTGPWGHDGRSTSLRDVILRHGGEAQAARDAFEALAEADQDDLLLFLGTLVLFPPPATASSLDPGDPSDPDYPLRAHGRIDLSRLFLDPAAGE